MAYDGMSYGGTSKGYGKKSAKRKTYNGKYKSIMNPARPTDPPEFMSESGPHGNPGNILHYPYVG